MSCRWRFKGAGLICRPPDQQDTMILLLQCINQEISQLESFGLVAAIHVAHKMLIAASTAHLRKQVCPLTILSGLTWGGRRLQSHLRHLEWWRRFLHQLLQALSCLGEVHPVQTYEAVTETGNLKHQRATYSRGLQEQPFSQVCRMSQIVAAAAQAVRALIHPHSCHAEDLLSQVG